MKSAKGGVDPGKKVRRLGKRQGQRETKKCQDFEKKTKRGEDGIPTIALEETNQYDCLRTGER